MNVGRVVEGKAKGRGWEGGLRGGKKEGSKGVKATHIFGGAVGLLREYIITLLFIRPSIHSYLGLPV